MNYTKLEEILHKEAGNIRVKCLTEKEFMNERPWIVRNLAPCNKKLKALFNENLEHFATFDDFLRFFEENKPSAIKIFFSRIFGWLYNDYTYLERIEAIEEDRDEYNYYVNLHAVDAAMFSEELNKKEWGSVRINTETGRFEALCRKHIFDEDDGSMKVLSFGILQIQYTKTDFVTLTFSPSASNKYDPKRDTGFYIELPEKYYKELEWDK